jgi:photosystem II stability/assembly factor-like uncharacterized protein
MTARPPGGRTPDDFGGKIEVDFAVVVANRIRGGHAAGLKQPRARPRASARAALIVGALAALIVGALALLPGARAARADGAPVARRWLSPLPTGDALRALWGTEAAVLAIGEGGTILRSTDHGGAWVTVSSGTTRHLNAIWGSAEGDLWIAGDEQTILRSTDGGVSWQLASPPAVGNLAAIWGSDPHDVYFAGGAGQLLHTDDHGRSFATLRPLGDTDEQLTAVWGSAADDLYVTGDRGSVLATQDHGQHWTTLRSQTQRPVSPETAAKSDTKAGTKADKRSENTSENKSEAKAGAITMAGTSALSITGTRRADSLAVFTSWAHTRKGSSGGMGAEHTADGGKTWKEVRVEPSPAPWPGYHAFFPADERTIYGVASFELGDRPIEERQRVGLIVSRDGGATFERRSFLPPGGGVNALWRDPTGPLIAVGAAGLILRSDDDGATWQERSQHPFGGATLRDVWSDGAGEVWIVGGDCTVLHSSDGGSRFEVQRPCPAGAGTELSSVWGSGADDVYVGGAFVAHTGDRGQHWAVVTPPAPVIAPWHLWGSGADDVYAAGYGIWLSSDGARNWRLVDGSRSRNPSDRFSDVFGVGNNRFAFSELGRLERGSKTGASWHALPPPIAGWRCCAFWADGARALYGLGPNHGFFRSTDAGKSFSPIATPLGKFTTFIALQRRGDLLYLLSDDPMLASSQRTVLTSDDDGLTWTTYATLPWDATAFAIVESDLLVVGTNGLVMRLR